MKKFNLINLKTNETHLCEKVVVDGHDYYVSDKETKFVYIPKDGIIMEQIVDSITNEYRQSVRIFGNKNHKFVLATNNPNIDLPKVVDIAERLAFDYYEQAKKEYYSIAQKAQLPKSNKEFHAMGDGFISGYNKSQETHPFSEDDVKIMLSESFKAAQEGYQITYSDEIIKSFKKDQPTIIYFE